MDLTTNGAVVTDAIKYVQGQMAHSVNSNGKARQNGVILGHGGQVFGVANVASNGHSLKISSVTDLVTHQDN